MKVAPETVQKALELVFGKQSDLAALSSLKSIDEPLLRSAYRRKALHFHPDRAETLGLDEQTLDELFKRLHGAYRLLGKVIVDRLPISKRFDMSGSSATTRQTPRRDDSRDDTRRFYGGRTPEKKLRFAQFLYYNGLIDWQSMIDAVTWQMQKRPKIGEIGRAYKFFDHSGILSVIRGKERVELFGLAAMRMGLVNKLQLNAMIGKQKSLNYPIGRYFLEKGTLSRNDLDTLLLKSKAHNRRYS